MPRRLKLEECFGSQPNSEHMVFQPSIKALSAREKNYRCAEDDRNPFQAKRDPVKTDDHVSCRIAAAGTACHRPIRESRKEFFHRSDRWWPIVVVHPACRVPFFNLYSGVASGPSAPGSWMIGILPFQNAEMWIKSTSLRPCSGLFAGRFTAARDIAARRQALDDLDPRRFLYFRFHQHERFAAAYRCPRRMTSRTSARRWHLADARCARSNQYDFANLYYDRDRLIVRSSNSKTRRTSI